MGAEGQLPKGAAYLEPSAKQGERPVNRLGQPPPPQQQLYRSPYEQGIYRLFCLIVYKNFCLLIFRGDLQSFRVFSVQHPERVQRLVRRRQRQRGSYGRPK